MFRETCRIINCDLVVKFPLAQGKSRYTGEGKRHTRTELGRIKKLSKWPSMRPYLPKVYYHDPKSGTLVMSFHPPFADHEEQVDALGLLVQRLILLGTGVRCTDLHSENIHQKRPHQKKVVIIDLGY